MATSTISFAQRWRNFTHLVKNPPKYLTACLLVSVGGLINGLDTSTIGPVITMSSFHASFGHLKPSLEGFIVSSILLPGIIFSFIGGTLSDYIGRAPCISLGTLIFSLGAALEASAISLPMFISGRLVAGSGQGIFLSTVMVYVCEIAPPQIRGTLTTGIQVMITLGLVVGFFTCYGTVSIPSSASWRLPLALQSLIALSLSISSYLYLPPSPRWLTLKGRHAESSLAWDALGVSPAEREKASTQTSPEVSASLPTTLPLKTRLLSARRDLKAVLAKDSRRPLLLGIFMMAAQQLSGIDGVVYYAPLLFAQAGLSTSTASFLASGVSAILILAFTLLAAVFAERWGRRTSTLAGGALMLACMLTLGLLYSTRSVHPAQGAGRWLAIVAIYVFSVGYSATWAVGLKLFAAEIQPAGTRAAASSLCHSANFVTNFGVALVTPVLLRKSSFGVYFLFAGCLGLTLGVSLVCMPETRGRDLEAVAGGLGGFRFKDTNAGKVLGGAVRRVGGWVGLRVERRGSGRGSARGARADGDGGVGGGIELERREGVAAA